MKAHRFAVQRGLIVVAMLAMLVSLAAIILVSLANRAVDSSSTREHIELADWLVEARQMLIYRAVTEDSTPGSLPCPDTPCGAEATVGLFRFDAQHVIRPAPPGACVQLVVAPSLRNTLRADVRGNDPAQKRINTGFVSDLHLIDMSGTGNRPWAVMLSQPAQNNCTLAQLGYAFAYDAATGVATLTAIADKNTRQTVIDKPDVVRMLLSGVLEAVDQAALDIYLSTYGTSISLATARNDMPTAFDAAIAGSAALYPATGSSCKGVVVTSSSSSSSSSAPPQTYKKPVSWLCFNDWYSHITYSTASKTFLISDASTGVTCSRPHAGSTTCTP